MNKPPPQLSIVAPCHNEQDGIAEFCRRAGDAARAVTGDDYELIVVDDGSRDESWPRLARLAANDPRLTIVRLSRRHGHQLALTAGLSLCRGERILTIDSDLQDPPELLAEMWRAMNREQADVVYGVRRQRFGETRFKRATAALFYWLLQRIGYADIPANAGDFRLMTRRVLDILNAMPEQHRFIRGMVSWIGYRQVALLYDRAPRLSGKSHYPISRMVVLAFDALTGFSITPLRLASFAGVLVGLVGLLMLAYTLGSWVSGHAVTGWTSLTTIVLILGSLQLLLFGLIGEYVGRLYIESKHRPLFVIDRIVSGNSEKIVPLEPSAREAPSDPVAGSDLHAARNDNVEVITRT